MKSNSQDPPSQPRRHAITHPAPKWAPPLHIPGCVKSPRRTPAAVSTSEPCGAESPVSANGRYEEGSWGGEGGERASGSVRSCLLIPELTASLHVRQTPHPTALPPRRNTHTPLLHATSLYSLSVSLFLSLSLCHWHLCSPLRVKKDAAF